ncbi:hypothetical protein Golax_013734 [Gossypium laxum]|uniref:Uncharacterized protein n=1 Tax=Gossypium laxum TaxID=34288 RepID=A0A7J8ZU09_9ROSI|nr:hypothetical protein [Gossypium laxum]
MCSDNASYPIPVSNTGKGCYRAGPGGPTHDQMSHVSYSNHFALFEYVKALVKVDTLDESELLKHYKKVYLVQQETKRVKGGLSALRNMGKPVKNSYLGTTSAPIHMVSSELGNFNDQLCRIFCSLALGLLLIFGIGALVEDRGISKGLGQ